MFIKKLSEINPKDCLTIWRFGDMYSQSSADYIIKECLTLKTGYKLTFNEDTKIKKDITFEEWINNNVSS